MRDIQVDRPTLGPFMSVICFRYLHDDAEDLAGKALIIDAGRQRGHDLIESLGLVEKHSSASEIQEKIGGALGTEGTRLCLIKSVTEKADGGYEVYSTECASPTYTLGVLLGAISAITGKKMLGSEDHIEQNGEGRIYHIEAF
jgi:hypothetical protein